LLITLSAATNTNCNRLYISYIDNSTLGLVIFRPHHHTMHVDAAYFYRLNSVVCHSHQPCKNSWTDWDAIWDAESSGPKEPWWGADGPMGMGTFSRVSSIGFWL